MVVFFGFNLVGEGEGKVEKAEMAQLVDRLCGGCLRGKSTIHRSVSFQYSDNTEENSHSDDDSQI